MDTFYHFGKGNMTKITWKVIPIDKPNNKQM